MPQYGNAGRDRSLSKRNLGILESAGLTPLIIRERPNMSINEMCRRRIFPRMKKHTWKYLKKSQTETGEQNSRDTVNDYLPETIQR